MRLSLARHLPVCIGSDRVRGVCREAFTEEDFSALAAEYESTMLGVLGFKPDKKWMAKRAKKKNQAATGEELAAFGLKV